MGLHEADKEELIKLLSKEMSFYNDDMDGLAKIICKKLPKEMVFRIINKLYRVRKTKEEAKHETIHG